MLECARRLGKTYLLCVLAVETCLRKPRARVVYGAQTIKEALEFVIPTIEAICEDAPQDCKPRYDAQRGHFVFPNGSHVAVFGCDDKRNADRGRGPGAELVIVDEAGFIRILRYVLRSVLRPQTLTTGGRTILASTPSDEPGHDFTGICEQAEANGTLVHRTIYDNPRLTKERIEEFIDEDAKDEGMLPDEYRETDTFRREYLAQRVTDKTLTVVPEWAAARAECFVEVERPEFFDAYGSLDPGGVDPHGHLFGYLDFRNNRFVIEDELLLREGQNTAEIAERVKEKEAALWGVQCHEGTLRGLHEAEWKSLPDWLQERIEFKAPHQPFIRVIDNDIQLARDLAVLNGIAYVPTEKDQLGLQVNALRILIRQRRLIVHPRCRNLDRHLLTTIWKNEKRNDFLRKHGEHGDLVAAAVYLNRNIRWGRNPFPEEKPKFDQLVRPKPPNPLKRAFGLVR